MHLDGKGMGIDCTDDVAGELTMNIGVIGGGSDGNFTADAGVPTLDGLGASGALLHNPGEFLNVDHFPQRTALTARLLMEL